MEETTSTKEDPLTSLAQLSAQIKVGTTESNTKMTYTAESLDDEGYDSPNRLIQDCQQLTLNEKDKKAWLSELKMTLEKLYAYLTPKPEESPKPQETTARQDLFPPGSKDTFNPEESKETKEFTWKDVLRYNNLSSVEDLSKLEDPKETRELSPPNHKDSLKFEESEAESEDSIKAPRVRS